MQYLQYCDNLGENLQYQNSTTAYHTIDSLTQDSGNSIANAMELPQSCAKPWVCLPALTPVSHNQLEWEWLLCGPVEFDVGVGVHNCGRLYVTHTLLGGIHTVHTDVSVLLRGQGIGPGKHRERTWVQVGSICSAVFDLEYRWPGTLTGLEPGKMNMERLIPYPGCYIFISQIRFLSTNFINAVIKWVRVIKSNGLLVKKT